MHRAFSNSCIQSVHSLYLRDADLTSWMKQDFTSLSLTESELQWLQRTCPYLTPTYLAYLSSYRYKPEQAKIKYIPVTSDNLKGHVEIEISGSWVETILWEVPLMACLSETYFQVVVVDWSYDGQDSTCFLPYCASASMHGTLEQALPMRRPGPYLKRSATSANLEHDVEDHIKHKTSLWKPWSALRKRFKVLVGYLVQAM